MRVSKILMVMLCIVFALGASAQKKVTYGKSTFTLYAPIANLEPTPVCGIKAPVPGYTLKQKEYGPGTYYSYAPGIVRKTSYKCLLTELSDWVFYRPEKFMSYMEEKGYKPVDEKVKSKMFKKTRILPGGLMYQLSETSWVAIEVINLVYCGAKPGMSNEKFIYRMMYIEQVPEQADVIADKIYRFWNDGAHIGDVVNVFQLNSKTERSGPTELNPNYFAIGESLNPKKGFYVMTFENGKPKYLWNSYEKVIEANMRKSDFDVSGEIKYDNPQFAFSYDLEAVKVGKNIYFSYGVSSMLLRELEPGLSWNKHMANLIEMANTTKRETDKVKKAHASTLENFYKEILK